MPDVQFPKNFVWGASSASFQIEGSPLADGASPSIWLDFTRKKGAIDRGDNADTACDHYNRYEEDIAIMADLGIDSYRFSLAWPRIVPEKGRINQKGLDFYSRLTDGLLKRGIRPLATLFHWDAPSWLFAAGGFTRAESVDDYLFYCEAVFKSLGDRIKQWVSINEPMVFAIYGYITGEMPPGKKNSLKGMCRTAHHLLMAHNRAVPLCRSLVPGGTIGIAQACVWMKPFNADSEKDCRAAELMDTIVNRMYSEPLYKGAYPELFVKKFGKHFPAGFQKEMADNAQPGDFIGVNYYTSQSYAHSPFGPLTRAKEKPTTGAKRSAMWEIYPEGLYNFLKRVKDEYNNLPCYVTENGYPILEKDGPVIDDDERIAYLKDHFQMASRAIKDGVHLSGY
ncbi:MAG: glycosyl hydrolase family protein, partial [Spirochaetales bacterium]